MSLRDQPSYFESSFQANYEKRPVIVVSGGTGNAWESWGEITGQLGRHLLEGTRIVVVDCYHGADVDTICRELRIAFEGVEVVDTRRLMKSESEIGELTRPDLSIDWIFGMMSRLRLHEFFDSGKVDRARKRLSHRNGATFIVGVGAALVAKRCDVLVYADMPRWEIQQRQRRHEIANLGVSNMKAEARELYRHSYFVDWPVLDRHKKDLLPRIDYLMDTTTASPKMLRGRIFRDALDATAKQPFRLVPFFDSGVWGGQWMKDVLGVDRDSVNYAWCFDCVPEENSLVLSVGSIEFEIPAKDLMMARPREVLGEPVYARFGAEFPIRFDLLDTVGGQNLSLQVHPQTDYIREQFGVQYTQDESYYILDSLPGSRVYLGVKNGVDSDRFVHELLDAHKQGGDLDVEALVAAWPVHRHDHFLIPAGTVHCSGANSLVLEISATPYLFTFKLWDWNRLDLDGRPRPVSIRRGVENIAWDRTSEWVRSNLINRVRPVASGKGWREEETGLHELEFIRTRRHWFSSKVLHNTGGKERGSVNVLNLVEGREAIVESPVGTFDPFVVHYAETFVVPASVGEYSVRPFGESANSLCGTIKATVRHC